MSSELSKREQYFNNPQLDAAVVEYGRKTYAHLLKQCGNKEIAKEALKSVLLDLYTTMEATGCEDPLQAMMYSQGQKFQNEYLQAYVGAELNSIMNTIVPSEGEAAAYPEVKAEPVKAKPVLPSEPIKTEKARSAMPEREYRQPAAPSKPVNEPRQVSEPAKPVNEPGQAAPVQHMPEPHELPNEPLPYPTEKKHGGFWGGLLIVVLILLILGLTWAIAGLAMSLELIPRFDLGYTWFNENIFWFF